jgi:single-strand DNA-binding protein
MVPKGVKMKRDFNKVIIEGRISTDVKTVEVGDKKIANFSIAVNNFNKQNEEIVSFFNCSVFVTDKLNQLLEKGKPLLLEGYLKQDRWEKDGQKYQAVKICVQSLHLMKSNPSEVKPEVEQETVDIQFAEEGEVNTDNYFG